jgi:2-octaprenyl-6-methoxyphenol hydroxylase
MPHSLDALVVGTGPVGYVAALALAQSGQKVALIGPKPNVQRDGRTVALLDGSVEMLKSLSVWDAVSSKSAPLALMRIIDDTGSLFRAPPVTFKASELKLDAFGYNIELVDLVDVLAEAVSNIPQLIRFEEAVSEFSHLESGVCVARLESGQFLAAPLLIGADGKKSMVRAFAGIASKQWEYKQTAITAVFSHKRDHEDISTEFHTRQGPFTLVPLPHRRSSLVWMMEPTRAERLAILDDQSFQAEVERQAQSMLGPMVMEGQRGIIPMAGLSTDRFALGNIALVGEAAHVFPPIGAQGLNLGFRDVAALMRALKSSHGEAALQKYNSARKADVRLRTAAVDLLNRSLLADYLPIDLARSVGLLTVASIAPLRRFMMRRGAGH